MACHVPNETLNGSDGTTLWIVIAVATVGAEPCEQPYSSVKRSEPTFMAIRLLVMACGPKVPAPNKIELALFLSYHEGGLP